jgi:signal peptidase
LNPSSTTYTPFRRPRFGLARKLAAGLLFAACLALAAVMLIPAALGYQRYVITSGSMTGTYDRGSLVYDEVVPVSELRVGNVITFTPPRGSGPTGRVTHRIIAIGSDRAGNRVFRTKGDANSSPDPWKITLSGPRQARVVTHVPYVGFVFAALAIKQVRMLVIGLPAILIALALLAGLWREAGEEARTKRDAAMPREAPEASLS